ncbi:putative histone-like transcription factor and archaeal histone [Colletotrichum sublineola]|uniref:DNA polymerase epsilon subunit D n=1 Tax=Colletotrichum sublineola TaxID=1173701 RepID=A0A066XV60_COLSU|nr:putative histone-like transcription factor and archaeal histone [Colletotrichum sublineola]
MPPRKSDASRRSDVSNARFIVMDEDPAPAATPAASATKTGANVAAGTPASAAKVKAKAKAKASAPASVSATPSSVPPAGAAVTPGSAAAAMRPTSSTTPHPGSEKKESQTHDKMAKADRDALTVEDLNLPKSIITRLAKGVLPPNTQIQGNAVLAMSKSATVFINYLASHANEITVNANKKTVSAEDVFKALDEIEFGFLQYNQIQSAKRNNYRQKVAAKKGGSAAAGVAVGAAAGVAVGVAAGAAAADASLLSNADDSVMTTASSETAPRAKKARVDDSVMNVDEELEDAETEPEEEAEEDPEEDEEEADEDDEEDEEEEGEGSGDETQDALEEKGEGSDVDEALDGDESD